MTKQRCLMIDLDGTLADIDHRRKKLAVDKDWKKFSGGIPLDRINEWCLEIINRFKIDHKIILVTGRMENYSLETEKWLALHKVYFDLIFYRKINDYRPDQIIKEEIFKEKILPDFNVLFVIDDRAKVVEKWRELGLVCLQCDNGNY